MVYGKHANDISSNGHNGTEHGVTLALDEANNPNQAYQFDGNDYITIQDISALKTLEREKANLISMFAHDMNSSLTGIHGLGLRLLKIEDLDKEIQRKTITTS